MWQLPGLGELHAVRLLSNGVAAARLPLDGLRRQLRAATAAVCSAPAAASHSGPDVATRLLLPLPLLLLAVRIGDVREHYTLAVALPALALISERLYAASELLASQCGGAARALVRVVFSNGTLVVYVSLALRKGALRLAQLALLGSVIVNLLAVTGGALLTAGLRSPRSSEPLAHDVGALSALLLLAAASVFAATTLVPADDGTPEAATGPSRLIASRVMCTLLLLLYAAWLHFAHVTHKHLFADDAAAVRSPSAASWGGLLAGVLMTRRGALCCALAIGAVCATVCATTVDMLERVGHHGKSAFIGGVALPFALNTGELAAALALADCGACAPAVSIALGAATQIMLCVLPSAVLGASLRGVPLGLSVHLFEACTLLLTVLLVIFALADGRADWLKGLSLLCAYLFVAVSFLQHDAT